MDFICTWIYLDSPEESSEYPQVGKKSHLADFQKVYWKCVAVFFALSTQFNPQRRHLLFSNKTREEIPQIDGFDLKSYLKEKNVEVVTLPLTWQTPEGYFGKWRNQFYIFDILEFIEKENGRFEVSSPMQEGGDISNRLDQQEMSPARTSQMTPLASNEPAFIILDSDCIINRPLDALFTEIRRQGLLALPMPYSETHNINGVTREQMRRIYAELDGKDPGAAPVYYGGEIFAATLPVIRQINAIAPGVWQKMLELYRAGQPKLNEEAHFLSYCYHKIGGFGSLEGFIKRIWTSPHYSNVQPEDTNLPIWHLPSEKTGGIALLFQRFMAKARPLPENRLREYLGIPRRMHYLGWKHFLKYSWLYRFVMKKNWILIFLLLILRIGTAQTIDSALIAHWTFNGHTDDSGFYGNHGIAFGAPAYTPGISGQALVLDGTDDFVLVPGNNALHTLDKELTFAGWVRPFNLSSFYLTIATKGNTEDMNTPFAIVYRSPETTPYIRITGDNLNYETLNIESASDACPLNQWTFVTWTFKSGKVSIYKNAELVASHQFNFTQLETNNLPLEIGRDVPGFATEHFFGLVDEIHIFNKALSDDQIEDIYLTTQSSASDDIEQEKALIKIFPNPASENATIAYTFGQKGETTITVFNALGELCQKQLIKNEPPGAGSSPIQTQNLPAGIYEVVVERAGVRLNEHLFILK